MGLDISKSVTDGHPMSRTHESNSVPVTFGHNCNWNIKISGYPE
jgi:hypothetical protein